MEVIWQNRCPSTLDLLIAALDDAHPVVWKQALDGLVVLASPEAENRLRAVAGRLEAEDERPAWFKEAIEQISEIIAWRSS